MTKPADPWDRLENESAVAYEAFQAYRDMGYERSLAQVGRALGKSKALMDRWSAAHRWVERVEAWDRVIERERAIRQRRDLAKLEDRVVKQANRMLDQFEQWLDTLTPAKVAAMSPTVAAAYWERAAKQATLALGGATENVGLAGDVAVKVAARRLLENPEAAGHVMAALDAVAE